MKKRNSRKEYKKSGKEEGEIGKTNENATRKMINNKNLVQY